VSQLDYNGGSEILYFYQDAQDCLERIRWSLILEVEQFFDLLEEVSAAVKVLYIPSGVLSQIHLV